MSWAWHHSWQTQTFPESYCFDLLQQPLSRFHCLKYRLQLEVGQSQMHDKVKSFVDNHNHLVKHQLCALALFALFDWNTFFCFFCQEQDIICQNRKLDFGWGKTQNTTKRGASESRISTKIKNENRKNGALPKVVFPKRNIKWKSEKPGRFRKSYFQKEMTSKSEKTGRFQKSDFHLKHKAKQLPKR